MTIVYLNGNYLPLEKAQISVMDRGFLFGDGVYEVIPVYHGVYFGLDAHLARLEQSLKGIGLNYYLSHRDWLLIFDELQKQNNFQAPTQTLYLQITRGATPKRSHLIPSTVEPTVFVMLTPSESVSFETIKKGFTAITLPDTRWLNCHIKTTALIANVLLASEAGKHQAQEAILLRDHHVMEGASSNVFIVKDNVIDTPPLGQILGGVTRDYILKLAKEHQITVHERPVTLEQLQQADEVWITSSTRGVLPIIQVDERPIGSGKAGPLWEKIFQLYQSRAHTATT